MPPEPLDGLIANPGSERPPKPFIPVHLENVGERQVVPFKKRIQRIAQDMLHADAPGVRPELLEGFQEARGRKRNVLVPDAAERVVTVRLRRIGRIEIHNAVAKLVRRARPHPLDQIAVRVDEREASACAQVLRCQCFDQRRFSDARLADDVDMRQPVRLFDAKQPARIAKVCACEVRNRDPGKGPPFTLLSPALLDCARGGIT